MALGKRREQSETDVDIDMVPIMNMFLVLIPFLLMSASFINLKVINSSTPVLSQGASTSSTSKAAPVKVTAVVELVSDGIKVSALSESVGYEDLQKWSIKIKKTNSEYPLTQMVAFLKEIKESYPKSDTLLIIPEKAVLYDSIIQVMDEARYLDLQKKVPLFANVVLSGKV